LTNYNSPSILFTFDCVWLILIKPAAHDACFPFSYQKGADSYTLLSDWSRNVNANIDAIANR